MRKCSRPHPAKIISPKVGFFKDQYNLTWTVDSFLPIKEYRILYREFAVREFVRLFYSHPVNVSRCLFVALSVTHTTCTPARLSHSSNPVVLWPLS